MEIRKTSTGFQVDLTNFEARKLASDLSDLDPARTYLRTEIETLIQTIRLGADYKKAAEEVRVVARTMLQRGTENEDYTDISDSADLLRLAAYIDDGAFELACKFYNNLDTAVRDCLVDIPSTHAILNIQLR